MCFTPERDRSSQVLRGPVAHRMIRRFDRRPVTSLSEASIKPPGGCVRASMVVRVRAMDGGIAQLTDKLQVPDTDNQVTETDARRVGAWTDRRL